MQQTGAVAYSSYPNPMNQQRGPQLSGGVAGHGMATGRPENLTNQLLTANTQQVFNIFECGYILMVIFNFRSRSKFLVSSCIH